LFRRTDGTIITKDCPVGLRKYRRRVATFAGAVLSSVLGLVSVSFAQRESKETIDATKVKIERTANRDTSSVLSGWIADVNGAMIPGAKVTISQKGVVKSVVQSNSEGVYLVSDLLPFDMYELEIRSPGFKNNKMKNLKVGSSEKLTLNVTMQVNGDAEIVGILVDSDAPLIETTSPTIKTTITRRQIENLPIRE